MRKITLLTELANFVAKSALASPNVEERRAAINGMRENLMPRPAEQKVTDLLGIVLALSARTRRLMQPPVEIDLDVFSPDSNRAVRLRFGRQS